jgi:protein ImuB
MILAVVVTDFPHASPEARVVWDDMLDALDAVSPLIDAAAPGVAYLDMRGVEGDPQRWIERAHRALTSFEMTLRVACAANAFVARAAAWLADRTVCAAGEERALLDPLALDLLDIDPRAQERLHLLGVKTLGDLGRLPHGPFVRRFGAAAATWHDRARGIDSAAFLPRGHALAIEATMFGEGGIDAEAHLAFALRILLDRVCTDLARLGQRCGIARIEFELENGDTNVRDVGLARPTADPKAILDILRAHLENVTFNAPIVGLRVRALRLEENGDAMGLFAGGEPDPQMVAITLARLEAALGQPARRARTVPAYALERQFAYEPFHMPKFSALPSHPEPVASRATPQLQLLAVREIGVRMKGGEPAVVDGRAVRQAFGPWRIDEGWFDVQLARDEYDVLLDNGVLCRIYHQGASWYMRGAYD